MIAGSDTSNGAASSLTERSGSPANRITSARRVGSDRAAKVRSSGELRKLTIWFSIRGGDGCQQPSFLTLKGGMRAQRPVGVLSHLRH